jgi:thermitase
MFVAVVALLATPVSAHNGPDESGSSSAGADGWIIYLNPEWTDLQSAAGLQSAFGDAETESISWYPGAYHSRFEGQTRDNDAIARLLSHPAVDFVEPNIILEYQTGFKPNDNRFNQQVWAETINLPEAWGITGGNADIEVAVIDSGVRTDHPDLDGKLLPGRNYTGDDNGVTDQVGHGTHVAGIIGAIANNEIGIAGVAMNTMIRPYRVGDAEGAPVRILADAIRDAVDDGVDIINVSLGAESPNSLLESAARYAYDNGVVFFAASGNDPSKTYFPASYQQTIAVGATSIDGTRVASFSSRLTNTDIAAPGVNVISTTWRPSAGNTYLPDSGTSFASPMGAGAAALMLAVNPDLSPEDIRAVLRGTARMEFEGSPSGAGSGLIDVYAALKHVIQGPYAQTWLTADEPVANFQTQRSWLWGPDAYDIRVEPYAESENGFRAVVYFDKSRMEVNDFFADRDSEWFVTNGLLVNELISGRMQVGDDAYVDRTPADVPVAGDPDGPIGPWYSSFAGLLDAPPQDEGAVIVDTLGREGNVGQNTAMEIHDVRSVNLIEDTGHRIADVFWNYLNSTGVLRVDGQYLDGPIFDPTFFATGFPVTNAYWTQVYLNDVETDVLVQCFERRCLTYTPSNDPGWQVEMGNVGRHYYQWRYDEQPSMVPAIPNPVTYAMEQLR